MPKKRVDQDFLDWLSYQPSCLDGTFSEYDAEGRGRCVACHVRRAGNAGIAFKPEYNAVPMTNFQHQHQHQHGELACVHKFLSWEQWGAEIEDIGAAKWFDNQAEKYLDRWKRETGR